VVNLASYTYEAMARKKLAIFKAKGVNGEIERTTVNDKPLYRIRVTGFESSRAARASIPDLQKTLGLEGAWIARR
jgi:cell division septation protein DedD